MYGPQGDPQAPPPPGPSTQPQQAVYGDPDLENIPSEYKKQGADWLAVFNPRVPRVLDVNLLWTFTHERCGGPSRYLRRPVPPR